MALSRSFKEDHPSRPLSTFLSSWRSMAYCPWYCASRQCLKLLNTSDLPRHKPLVIWFHIAWTCASAAWTGLCCMHPPDRLPQLLPVLSSGIVRKRHIDIYKCSFPGLPPTPPSPHPHPRFAGNISLSSGSLASFLASVRSMSFPTVFCIVLHSADLVSMLKQAQVKKNKLTPTFNHQPVILYFDQYMIFHCDTDISQTT